MRSSVDSEGQCRTEVRSQTLGKTIYYYGGVGAHPQKEIKLNQCKLLI